jgi:hypothetical protein
MKRRKIPPSETGWATATELAMNSFLQEMFAAAKPKLRRSYQGTCLMTPAQIKSDKPSARKTAQVSKEKRERG